MKFLAVFASSTTLAQFRHAEFVAVVETLHVPCKIVSNIPWMQYPEGEEFCIFESDDLDGVMKVAQRCILLRAIYILFQASTQLELVVEYRKQIVVNHGSSSSNSNNGETKTKYSDKSTSNHIDIRGNTFSTFENNENRNDEECCCCAANAVFHNNLYIGESELEHVNGDYCYHVETIGKKYSQAEKNSIIHKFCDSHVPVHAARTGNVNYSTPAHSMYVICHHARQETPPGTSQTWNANGPLLRVFHCKLYTLSCRSELLHTYDLKTRMYIGTTSMPVEESFVMANLSHVQWHDWVYDPFCGTGSLLVAAAAFGAQTLGSEVDARAMRGGSWKDQHSLQVRQQRQLAKQATLSFLNNVNNKDSNKKLEKVDDEELEHPTMLTNFKVYHLPLPERIRLNFATWPIALNGMKGNSLDAILTDPPYGIREPRKVVRHVDHESQSYSSDVQHNTQEICQNDRCSSSIDENKKETRKMQEGQINKNRLDYCIHDVCIDLLAFAAFHLRLGGHLTLFYPTTDSFSEDELPTHPAMRLKYNLPQRLSLKFVRRLLTWEKCANVHLNNNNNKDNDNVGECNKQDKAHVREQVCLPRMPGTDLRALMDITELPNNEAYTHYRKKLEQKRMAAAAFHLRNDKNSTALETNHSLSHELRADINCSKRKTNINDSNNTKEVETCKDVTENNKLEISNSYVNNSNEKSIVGLHEKRPRKKGRVNATDIVNNRARKLRARAEEAKKNNSTKESSQSMTNAVNEPLNTVTANKDN